MLTGTVLLVAGDEGREAYSRYCRENGLTVVDASRPEEALARLEHAAPDVAVTDIVFTASNMDGKAFVRARRQRLAPSQSIIVMSGYAREEDRESARRSGADAYLVRPT